MKRRIVTIGLVLIMMLALAGCKKSGDDTKKPITTNPAPEIVVTGETKEDNQTDAAADASKEENSADASDISNANADTESGADTESDADSEEDYDEENEGAVFKVEYPSEGKYYSDSASTPAKAEFSWVKQVSKAANGIIDTEEWLGENGFPIVDKGSPEAYYLEGDGYCIYRSGVNESDRDVKGVIDIYDEEFNTIAELDFGDFVAANNVVYDNWPVCESDVVYAALDPEMKIAYVSIGHGTYAKYYADNAYICAVDLEDGSLIWKSNALVSNARNFAIVGDTIFCGYGFTDEDDYLYALDRYTGKVLHKEKLKTGPDYIFEKDNQLYVRTYDTDYVFDIVKE